MTSKKLFFKRVTEEYKFQWGVIRSVFDWSILVYLVIPTIIMVPFLYQDAWQFIHFYWNENIPFSILLFAVLLLALRGNFRTYLMEADLLFLIQRKTVIQQLKQYNFLLSALQLAVGLAVIMIGILPVLILVYNFSPLDVLYLYLAVSGFRFLTLTIKKIVTSSLMKWLFLSLTFSLVFVLIVFTEPFLYGMGSLICILFIVIYHLTKETKTNRWFSKEIEIEEAERSKYIKLILNFSMEVEKESSASTQHKKPLLYFPKSKRMYKRRNKKNGLLELLFKAFFRNKKHVTMYCQLLLITSSAIIVLPIWLKWILFVIFSFFMHSWLRALYHKMLADPFLNVIPYEKELSKPVWDRFKRLLYVPPVVLAGVLTLLLTILSM
ncbi:ABC transporter permease [Bacillus taeanensis]|nr:ABC transporter permease [Bacillus taeanensis]